MLPTVLEFKHDCVLQIGRQIYVCDVARSYPWLCTISNTIR